jgi:uncharacterized protein (TIGR02599 family)
MPILSSRANPRKSVTSAFTLMELLVAMAILGILLVAVSISLQGVQSAWRLTRSAVRENLEGRRALETVVTNLSRATLHQRWVPNLDPNNNPSAIPTALLPESDLHFVSGPSRILLPGVRYGIGHSAFFQGPFGFPGSTRDIQSNPDTPLYQTLPHTLSAWGYYVEFGLDPTELPNFLTTTRQGRPAPPRKHRFRLMEYRQPAHELPLFVQPDGYPKPLHALHTSNTALYEWFQAPVSNSQPGSAANNRRVSIVAENILALVIVPYDPYLVTLANGGSNSTLPYQLAPDYHFDSRRHQWEPGSPLSAATRHQLPPAVEIAVVSLAEDVWDNLSEAEAIRQGQSLVSLMSGLFLTSATYSNDLETLDRELNNLRLDHQIMTQVVLLNGQAGRLAVPNSGSPTPSTASAP